MANEKNHINNNIDPGAHDDCNGGERCRHVGSAEKQ
jgi:hypothetical protein